VVYLTFGAEFNATHKLWNSKLSDERNVELFAECANPSGHGHMYRVEITVKGNVSGRFPVVIDRSKIQHVMESILGPRLREGNMDTAFGKRDFISTGENIVREIWNLVVRDLPAEVELACVRLNSTSKNSFTYFGSDEDQGRLA
jgi:6-pyruvoyltetrahydropterin/6-carboxytetrahydropterin synthase